MWERPSTGVATNSGLVNPSLGEGIGVPHAAHQPHSRKGDDGDQPPFQSE